MASVASSPAQVKNSMPDEKSATALVKHGGEVSRITTPSEFRSYLEVKREERWHLLTPATDFGSLPPQWALVPTVVTIDPDPKGAKDVYVDKLFCEGDEVALSAVALRKIANAGGSIIRTLRLDDGRIPNFWSYKAVIRYRSFVDALWKEAEGESDYDLRDDSPRIKKMISAAKRSNRDPAGQIEGARMHGAAGCESRAINRAIRGAFALKQKYTARELAKPFVAFNLVFQPDMADPQQKAAVLANALGGTEMLYGGTPAPALPAAGPVSHASSGAIEGETVNSEPIKAGPAQPANAVPFDEEPEQPKATKQAEPTFHISGVFASGGNFFLKTVEAPDLVIWTDDKTTAQAAVAAKKANTELVIETEKRASETWLIGFSTAEKL